MEELKLCPKCEKTGTDSHMIKANQRMALVTVKNIGTESEPAFVQESVSIIGWPHVCADCGYVELYATVFHGVPWA